MGVTPSRSIDLTVNSVALECYANSFTQNIEQNMFEVTTFCDTGPRTLVDSNTWGAEFSGPWDGASGTLDDTIWGLLGSTGVAYVFQPTGSTGTASQPEYSGTVVLRNYRISAQVGQAIQHQTGLMGNSAISRDAT